MTHVAYLFALLVSLVGLAVLDRRYKLAFFDAPRRASFVIAISVGVFVVWDALGIGLGIFMRGHSLYDLPLELFPEFPLEELFFLTLLCYLSLLSYIALKRWRSA